MKGFFQFLIQIALTATCLADAVPGGILIDRVWSGHPVGFDILTERGHQFIAYFDSERRLTVKGRSLGDANWTTVHPEGTEVTRRNRMSNMIGWDSHNCQTLGFDNEKRPVALYHRFDSEGKSQAFVARPDSEGQWLPKQISDWSFRLDFSGGGSQNIPMNLGAPSPVDGKNLLASFSTKSAGSGRWLLDGASLALIETLPASKSLFPEGFSKPVGTFPGLAIHTEISQSGADRWVLRWETLGPNRDLEYREAPPPSELRLYQFPVGEVKQDSSSFMKDQPQPD